MAETEKNPVPYWRIEKSEEELYGEPTAADRWMPPFKTGRGALQDVTDIGRYTIGMENPLGRELKEQLEEDTSKEILKWIEIE